MSKKSMMSKIRKSALASAALVSLAPLSATAEEGGFNGALDKAVEGAKVLFDARLRYEHADFENISKHAHAFTYRIRAGLETGAVYDTKFLVEFDHVESFNEDFNSTINGNLGVFPVVADPDVTELNRFQLTNTSLPDTTVTIGRQRIIHPTARFVGNVGWRQNEQTYDAIRVENTSIKNLKIDVSYIDQVNRIFGDDSPAGRFESDSWLVHGSYKVPVESVKATVSAFAYLLDFENDSPRNSTQTYGGSLNASKGPIFLEGTYANQTPYASSTLSNDVNYYTVAGGIKKDGYIIKAGYEVLGGDGTAGFVTPLATLHKFNGFADVFIATGTPANGLTDLYVQAGVTKKGVGPFAVLAANVFYHQFSAEEGGADYGDEIDAVIVAKLKSAKRLKYILKYANYQEDGFFQDAERFTAEVNLTF